MAEKLGIINNYAGAVVSLNQKKAPYFGVGMMDHGKFKVWLSKRAWCVQLPNNLTDKEADQIRLAISSGLLIEGKVYMPTVEKDPKVLAKYLTLIKNNHTLDSRSKAPFQQLVLQKQDGNYTAIEILSECLRSEEATRRRPTWIAFLNDAIKAYDGPLMVVEDYKDDPEAYQVTIDMSNGIIIEDSRKTTELVAPVSKTPQKVKSKELNKFFGDEV